MIDKLNEYLAKLPEWLDDRSRWDSLIVNRRKPHTYRVFTQDGDYRICLHKFNACDTHESFAHPHAWPAAFAVLEGAYEMWLGYGDSREDTPLNSMWFSSTMSGGMKYEMINPLNWHSVTPLCDTYTVMVNGLPYDESIVHKSVRTTKGKDLDKMPEDELIAHLAKFKELLLDNQ